MPKKFQTANIQALFQIALGQEPKRPEQAIQLYKRILSVDPCHPGAMVNIGTRYFLRENIPQAIHWYKKALAVQPRYPLALNNLGLCYQDSDKKTAIWYFHAALTQDPLYHEVHYNLAVLYDTGPQKIFPKALKHYRRYLAGSQYEEKYHNIAQQRIQELETLLTSLKDGFIAAYLRAQLSSQAS